MQFAHNWGYVASFVANLTLIFLILVAVFSQPPTLSPASGFALGTSVISKASKNSTPLQKTSPINVIHTSKSDRHCGSAEASEFTPDLTVEADYERCHLLNGDGLLNSDAKEALGLGRVQLQSIDQALEELQAELISLEIKRASVVDVEGEGMIEIPPDLNQHRILRDKFFKIVSKFLPSPAAENIAALVMSEPPFSGLLATNRVYEYVPANGPSYIGHDIVEEGNLILRRSNVALLGNSKRWNAIFNAVADGVIKKQH